MRIGGNCCQWGEAGPGAERRVCAFTVDLAGMGEPTSLVRSRAIGFVADLVSADR